MRGIVLAALAALAAASLFAGNAAAATDPASLVDPLIGTGGDAGHTFPGRGRAVRDGAVLARLGEDGEPGRVPLRRPDRPRLRADAAERRGLREPRQHPDHAAAEPVPAVPVPGRDVLPRAGAGDAGPLPRGSPHGGRGGSDRRRAAPATRSSAFRREPATSPSTPAAARPTRAPCRSPAAAGTVRGFATDDGFCGGPASPTIHFAARFDRPIASYSSWGEDGRVEADVEFERRRSTRVARSSASACRRIARSG